MARSWPSTSAAARCTLWEIAIPSSASNWRGAASPRFIARWVPKSASTTPTASTIVMRRWLLQAPGSLTVPASPRPPGSARRRPRPPRPPRARPASPTQWLMASMCTATTRAPGAARATAITSSGAIVIGSPSRKRAPPALTTTTSGRCRSSASAASGTRPCRPRGRASGRPPSARTPTRARAARRASPCRAGRRCGRPPGRAKSPASSTATRGPSPCPSSRSTSGGWHSTGTPRGSSRTAVSSRWSAWRCVTTMPSRSRTTSSAGSGSPTVGFGTGFGVLPMGGRAPASSSIGSTSSRRPPSSTRRVAWRTSVRRIPPR